MRNQARKAKEVEKAAITDSPASRRFLPWMLILFVGSGCAALIYEVVWLQLLQLTVGSTGISLGVLLGTFMGGMCLGSLLLPRLISADYHPLRVYAFLELGIGVIGVAILFGMPLLTDLYIVFTGHGVLARAVVAVICLIPPTILMGATLPAVARCVKATKEGVSWMGWFYAGNTAGAVLGCLTAGFYLLRLYDMPTATYTAVAINITVAVVALVLVAKIPWRKAATGKADPLAEDSREKFIVYVIIALSGLCALGAEVVWTRLLSLTLGATVYTFSIILAVFLSGIGIGSSIGAFLTRRIRRARVALGTCQLLIAAAVFWAALFIYKIPYWDISPNEITKEYGPWMMFLYDILRATIVVLPGSLLWGASFPFALAAVATRNQDSGRMVGGIYAANTVGAILGSLAFSMMIIPMVGTQGGHRIIIILAAISSTVAFSPLLTFRRIVSEQGAREEQTPGWSQGKLTGAILSLTTVFLFIVFVPPVNWAAVAFGRNANFWEKRGRIVEGLTKEEEVPFKEPSRDHTYYCIYVGEGMNVSVAVSKSTNGRLYFHGAGKVQASTNPKDMRLQRMLGHLSVLTRPNPREVKDVLVVACGAGVTAGSFIPYPDIENITVCDIESLVPKVVTPMFGKENYHIVDGIDKENPHRVQGKKVRVVYDDGRHYIRTLSEDKKYDIITSDPIDPWVKGCAALNTVEYYQMCREHLKPGGVMTLWMPLYESDHETVKSLVSTFFKIFPNGIFFSNDFEGAGFDGVLLGYVEPTTINLDHLQQILSSPDFVGVKNSLEDVAFGADTVSLRVVTNTWHDSAIALMATYAGRASDLGTWMEGAQINTDRNMRLQYLAGMAVNVEQRKEILDRILEHCKFPENVFRGSSKNIQSMKQALYAAKRINPKDAETYDNLGCVFATNGKIDEAIHCFSKAIEIDPDYVEAYNELGYVYASMGNSDKAINYFTKAIDIEPEYAAAHNNLGHILADQGRLEDAFLHFLEAIRIAPDNAAYYTNVGLVARELGRIEEAAECFSKAIALDPHNAVTYDHLGLTLLQLGRIEEAIENLNQALNIDDSFDTALKHLQIALGEREKVKTRSAVPSPQN